MIAINLNKKLIRIRHDKLVVPFEEMHGRFLYLELSYLWMNSPWLQAAPFGYDGTDNTIFMLKGWELQHTDVYGDLVGILM